MTVEALSRHLINFKSEVENKMSSSYSDPLVISTRVNRFVVKRILIEMGSFINLIMLEVFDKMSLDKKKNLSRAFYPLMGLGDKSVPIIGITNLTIFLRDEKYKREIYTEFMVADIPLSYNVILGQSIFNNHGVIINMEYLCLKLQTMRSIEVARGS